MNKQTVLQWLNNIGLEQLFGIAVGSSVLCLCCLLINRLLRTRSASFQACVWHATCGALVLSGMVLSAVPGIPFRPAADVAEDSLHVGSRAVAVLPQLPPSQPAVWDLPATESSGDVPHKSGSWPVKTLETVGLPAVQRSSSAVSPTVESADALTVDPQEWSVNIPALLAGIWLSVAAILLSAFVRSILVCRAIVRRSSRQIPEGIQAIASRVSERLNASVIPQLMLCDDLKIPFTAGVIRPVIVLPGGSTQWPTQKLEMVIAHELAHVQRRDVFWHWIGRLAVILAWFNPLVWLTAGRGVLNREQACDDRVIGAGFEGTQYGECLVEIAAAVSGRILPATAAVSMAEPPLKQRLQNVLSPSVNRARETRAVRGLVIATFFILATFIGIIRPFATAPAADKEEATQQSAAFEQDSAKAATPQTSNAKDSDDASTAAENDSGKKPNKEAASGKPKTEELIELTKPVVGKIVDEDKKPVAGAEVLFKLRDFGKDTGRNYRELSLRSWQVTTDKHGQYSIDVSDLGPQPSHYCLGVERADKTGFAQGSDRYWLSVKEVRAIEELNPVVLRRGRPITGQIVSATGRPVNGVFRVFAVPDFQWSSGGTAIEKDGKMVINVPVASDVQIIVYADDHSPKAISIAPDQSELGVIKLERGTSVTGQVLDRDNKPAAGVGVSLESTDSTFPATWSRSGITNADGKFKLAPVTGKCQLSLHPFSIVNDKLDGIERVIGNRPPYTNPITLDLSAAEDIHEVKIREAETWKVSGTASWDDGTPVRNFQVTGSVQSGNNVVEVDHVATNDDGEYSLRLPKDSEAVLSSFGAYRDGDSATWYMAYGSISPPAVGYSQFITIEKLDGDIADANWKFKIFRVPATQTKSQKEATNAYKALREEWETQSEAYRAAAAEDQDTLDPRNVLATKYLAFEEMYRGEKEAVQAIVNVLQGANSVADADSAVAKARIEMVERLIEYYLGHEDLADTFGSLTAGPETPRADEFLRLAFARSPHAVVRASSLMIQAKRARQQLRDYQHLPEIEQMVAERYNETALRASGMPEADVERTILQVRKRLKSLKAIDAQQLRRQIIDWLKIIEKDYGDLERPHMFGHTFGQDAKALRFAIEHVNLGQPAPPFEAIDINARPFRLGDELGKVVVITFNQSIFDAADDLPHQELSESLKGQGFQLVSIVATESREKFIKNAHAANVKGAVIWEPLRGAFQSRWGVDSFPTTFIVDRSGKLRHTRTSSADFAGVVKALLTENF